MCRVGTGHRNMARDDGKRNFALREDGGDESSVFSGSTPRQAALKAARRLEDAEADEEAARAAATEIRLRERGTDRVHVYDAWAWESTAPDDSPDWMPSVITEANVSKKRIDHLES